MTEAILTLNAGSSSLKFALFEIGAEGALARRVRGGVESVGTAPKFKARDAEGKMLAEESWPADAAPADLARRIVEWAEAHLGGDRLAAVGHRIVHGGPDHAEPERVTPDLLEALRKLAPLAPLHEPQNVAPIRLLAAARPDLVQVACFDTAFHRTMPATAARFALPADLSAAGIRRYGFHGLSYDYIARQLKQMEPALAAGRVIVAHLGNGASLCALQGGRSVDTTMGLTPLDGLVMGTRSGNLDPGVVLYLVRERGLSIDEIEDMLYRRSGLLGVSGGIASDMRALLASTDPKAQEAVELFVYRAVREIGALTASLGGLDGLVFTAGIGEHQSQIRARITAGLGWLGAELEPEANERHAAVINSAHSRMALRVIPTDEELMIARYTHILLQGEADSKLR